jgi:hypothetical protein
LAVFLNFEILHPILAVCFETYHPAVMDACRFWGKFEQWNVTVICSDYVAKKQENIFDILCRQC